MLPELMPSSALGSRSSLDVLDGICDLAVTGGVHKHFSVYAADMLHRIAQTPHQQGRKKRRPSCRDSACAL